MDVNSFYTYRDRLVLDDFGQPTDPRFCSPDIDYGASAPGGNYVDAYLSAIGAAPPVSAAPDSGPTPVPEPDIPPAPTPGEVTDYYVGPSGSNGNPGTDVLPFLTIQYAVDQMADGESLTVLDGTYAEGCEITTANLTILAQSSNHVIHSSAENDIITITSADGVILSGIKVADAQRRGFSITGSDDVFLYDCEADACNTQGGFSSNCARLTISGGNYSNTVEQHGWYHSIAGDDPTFIEGTYSGNGRAGIQINSQGGAGAINAENGGIFNCTIQANGQTGVAAGLNLLGVQDLVVQETTLLYNLAGGISMASSDSGDYSLGSKRCSFIDVSIYGRRGISYHTGSTNGYMDGVTIETSDGCCFQYDASSADGLTLTENYSLIPAPDRQQVRNDTTNTEMTVAAWRAL
jgi:hypothetical protein